ncbi:unnamed protein product [Thlaspi arvense]|uniref:Uncharacterized protein n=1 Tax=Thlaspi arvense TaxID=13288 RepID=A0AAU9R9W8_THLAR|nr:unnamed protein product [Thlaspi arvense]
MSVERSLEAWEEVQRHGQDLADRLAQGFTGLIQINPPSFPWPNHQKLKLFDLEFPSQQFAIRDSRFSVDQPINGVSAILDIGNKIGQAGVDFGAGLNVMVQQFFRRLPLPFRHDEDASVSMERVAITKDDSRVSKAYTASSVTVTEEKATEFDLRIAGLLGRSKGTVEISSSYDSRTSGTEHSLAARGDLWRVEASTTSSSSSRDDSPSLFLLQLGPLLFLRDSTLLLPVHLSKQHLLWYGYDRQELILHMKQSFVDLQFPNGQLTYVSGEGLTTSVFVPLCGGLLQAQGQYPGDMRFSFSCKTKQGTRITPMVNWPEKSFGIGVSQALTWRKSGIMMKPAIQLSVCSTFGGNNPGMKTEVIHSLNDNINMICGCECARTAYPSAFASVSFGRSKWNGNIGRNGIVVRADTPLGSVGRPSFSIQLNNAFEF